jgi:hypothetical protein
MLQAALLFFHPRANINGAAISLARAFKNGESTELGSSGPLLVYLNIHSVFLVNEIIVS